MDQGAPIRVMLVDDHAVVRSGLKAFLMAFDDLTLVGEAGSGFEALALLDKARPDVILMDLMMPEMDGWEVYQKMKASEDMRDIPVIVVTAKAQSIDRVLGLHIARVNDYITKPFGPQELLDSVERVLNQS